MSYTPMRDRWNTPAPCRVIDSPGAGALITSRLAVGWSGATATLPEVAAPFCLGLAFTRVTLLESGDGQYTLHIPPSWSRAPLLSPLFYVEPVRRPVG